MSPFNNKFSILPGRNLTCFLVVMTQLLLLSDLLGQSQKTERGIDEPVLKIRVEQIGQSDDVSYSSVLERIYAVCSQWTGGSVGTGTPAGFIANAGGLVGLKPRMGIPFYARSFSGEAKGSDGSTASVVTAGDGLGYWTEQLGDNSCTEQDDPEEQPSRTMSVRFERTENGARITFDAGIVSAGCATYIGFISVHQMEVDPALIQRFCTFELSNEELNNWKNIEKKNAQIFNDDNGKLTAIATLTMDVDEPKSPEVTITGCSVLGIGEKGEVTANASTEGGSYRFWAEPKEILTVESKGASAILRGSSPGRGMLYVEYTNPEGKTAKASKIAACIKVESYNGGQAIPQISLFDIDGKKLEGILKVPVEAQPKEASDLLEFVPADPGMLTAIGLGDVVALQAIHTGITTVQALTECGGKTGPSFEVEVVNCDDETIAALERMRQVAMKSLLEANDELRRIAGSEKFNKAREEIVGSLWEMHARLDLLL